MSEQLPPPPPAPFQQPAQAPQEVPRSGSGLATAALVLGIVSIVVAFIPVINQIVFLVALVGIILAIIALVKKAKGKSKAIAGLILSVLGAIIATIVILVSLAFLNSVKDSLDSASSGMSSVAADLNKEVKVKYVVTADHPAKADYNVAQGTENAPVQGTWEKEITFTGSTFASISLVPADLLTKGNFACEIFIDGQSVSKKSGDSIISCSGSSK
ncbi:MAG: DUF4190 domain-containing protein [Renibacterium sp.]|nr:DUF4190 domain-containing protein [Renibacterium sp.]